MTYRRDITQGIFLARKNLAQDTSHDLPRSRLREIVDDEDCLWCGERSDRLPHLHDQVLLDLVGCLVAILKGNKGIYGLAR